LRQIRNPGTKSIEILDHYRRTKRGNSHA
jgi:hypothetical protein